MSDVVFDSSFAHTWQAEVLAARPLILPARQFVYPAEVEEVERGALEVLVRPPSSNTNPSLGESALPFLATCALGFANPLAPSGIWTCPHPGWICAVAGGYAYLIDTDEPRRWQQVEYRPVTEIRALPDQGLLLFSGFHSLLAWGRNGRAWQTARLSWEGVRIAAVSGNVLSGFGWEIKTDRELEFEVDLLTGKHRGGAYLT
jgi:hypothetical protein